MATARISYPQLYALWRAQGVLGAPVAALPKRAVSALKRKGYVEVKPHPSLIAEKMVTLTFPGRKVLRIYRQDEIDNAIRYVHRGGPAKTRRDVQAVEFDAEYPGRGRYMVKLRGVDEPIDVYDAMTEPEAIRKALTSYNEPAAQNVTGGAQ
jgi:hypothetical protein